MKFTLFLFLTGSIFAGAPSLRANQNYWPKKNMLGLVALFNVPEAEYQWRNPLPSGNAMQRMVFTDSDHGYAVGSAGMVLETLNQGLTWQAHGDPCLGSPDYIDLILLPDSSLLAVGTAPGLFLSTDGGRNWDLPMGDLGVTFWDLAVRPDGGISIAGENGRILLSMDQGKVWNEMGPGEGEIRSHLWLSNQDAIAVGNNFAVRTGDAGMTWQPLGVTAQFGFVEVFSPAEDKVILADNFADSWVSTDNGHNFTKIPPVHPGPLYIARTLVLTEQHWLRITFGEGQEIWETQNAGLDWENLQWGYYLGYTDIVQIASGRILVSRSDGQILYSDDLGQTLEIPPGNLHPGHNTSLISHFATRPDGVIYAENNSGQAGASQEWYRSDDGGRTWSVPAASPDLNFGIIDCLFMNNVTGIAVGVHEVASTNDGGVSWQNIQLPMETRTLQLAQAGNRCFLVCNILSQGGRKLYQSDDGGRSWQVNAGGISEQYVYGSIYFLNEQTGFISGSCSEGRCLYTTVDGGESWTKQVLPQFQYVFEDMLWTSDQTGFATLFSSALKGIHRTTDGGAHWQQVSDIRASKLFRRSNGQLAATARSENILISDDQGLTWQEWHPPFGRAMQVGKGSVMELLPLSDGWLLGGGNSTILDMTMPESPDPDAKKL